MLQPSPRHGLPAPHIMLLSIAGSPGREVAVVLGLVEEADQHYIFFFLQSVQEVGDGGEGRGFEFSSYLLLFDFNCDSHK